MFDNNQEWILENYFNHKMNGTNSTSLRVNVLQTKNKYKLIYKINVLFIIVLLLHCALCSSFIFAQHLVLELYK